MEAEKEPETEICCFDCFIVVSILVFASGKHYFVVFFNILW